MLCFMIVLALWSLLHAVEIKKKLSIPFSTEFFQMVTAKLNLQKTSTF